MHIYCFNKFSLSLIVLLCNEKLQKSNLYTFVSDKKDNYEWDSALNYGAGRVNKQGMFRRVCAYANQSILCSHPQSRNVDEALYKHLDLSFATCTYISIVIYKSICDMNRNLV